MSTDNLPTVAGFYDRMERQNIILSFKGEITSELVTSVLMIIEGKLEHSDDNEVLKKKVFYILTECLQNLHHHANIKNEGSIEKGSGIFAISKAPDGGYVITTGNLIPKDKVEELDTKLKAINSLTPEEIKKYRMEVLTNGKMSEKGGGGLGMIEIVKRAGKIDYAFSPMDEQYCFFSMDVKLT